jgi:hypothetical protein
MVSKKALGIILVSVIGISLIAMIPVFLYGFSVNAVEVRMQIMTADTATPSMTMETSGTSYDYDIWDAGFSVPPEAEERVISAYEYFFSKLGGQMTVNEEGSVGDQIVDIIITFDLTTPSNNSLSYTFQPTDLKGEGLKDIIVLLGPDEFNGETGEFSLTITISVVVTLPPPLNTMLEFDLVPVNTTFEVPA